MAFFWSEATLLVSKIMVSVVIFCIQPGYNIIPAPPAAAAPPAGYLPEKRE